MVKISDIALGLSCVLALLGCGSGESGKQEPIPNLFDGPAADVASDDRAAPLEIPEGAPTVVFLGDSMGAGLHLAEHQAFPAVLQARLAEEGLPFHLVNASESGRTTAGGVTALAWVLRSKPDVVVIELGGNDGLRGIALEEIEKNLRSMIATAREADANVLLLGVRLPPNYGEYGASFDALFPALAAEFELAFVPYFMEEVGGVAEQNLADGLHPTAEGQKRLAENVQAGLRELLQP